MAVDPCSYLSCPTGCGHPGWLQQKLHCSGDLEKTENYAEGCYIPTSQRTHIQNLRRAPAPSTDPNSPKLPHSRSRIGTRTPPCIPMHTTKHVPSPQVDVYAFGLLLWATMMRLEPWAGMAKDDIKLNLLTKKKRPRYSL